MAIGHIYWTASSTKRWCCCPQHFISKQVSKHGQGGIKAWRHGVSCFHSLRAVLLALFPSAGPGIIHPMQRGRLSSGQSCSKFCKAGWEGVPQGHGHWYGIGPLWAAITANLDFHCFRLEPNSLSCTIQSSVLLHRHKQWVLLPQRNQSHELE